MTTLVRGNLFEGYFTERQLCREATYLKATLLRGFYTWKLLFMMTTMQNSSYTTLLSMAKKRFFSPVTLFGG